MSKKIERLNVIRLTDQQVAEIVESLTERALTMGRIYGPLSTEVREYHTLIQGILDQASRGRRE